MDYHGLTLTFIKLWIWPKHPPPLYGKKINFITNTLCDVSTISVCLLPSNSFQSKFCLSITLYQLSVCLSVCFCNNHNCKLQQKIEYDISFRWILCGPDRGDSCKVGARTVAPCSHGATVLLAGCVLPSFPVREAFKNYLQKNICNFPRGGGVRPRIA